MVLWKQLRNIHLAIPAELLYDVDQAAKSLYMSRSEYIRFVLHNEIRTKYPEQDSKPANTWYEHPEFLDSDDG